MDGTPQDEIGLPVTDRDRLPFVIAVGNEGDALESMRNTMVLGVLSSLLVGALISAVLIPFLLG